MTWEMIWHYDKRMGGMMVSFSKAASYPRTCFQFNGFRGQSQQVWHGRWYDIMTRGWEWWFLSCKAAPPLHVQHVLFYYNALFTVFCLCLFLSVAQQVLLKRRHDKRMGGMMVSFSKAAPPLHARHSSPHLSNLRFHKRRDRKCEEIIVNTLFEN